MDPYDKYACPACGRRWPNESDAFACTCGGEVPCLKCGLVGCVDFHDPRFKNPDLY